MRIASVGEMLRIEEEATAKEGITTRGLMENAGKAVADEAAKMLSLNDHVVVVCGAGNNGGDGLVAARHLHIKSFKPTVFLLSTPKDLSRDAEDAYLDLNHTLVEPIVLDASNVDNLTAALKKAPLIIDAIFGFGLKGAVRGIACRVIEIINDSICAKLSVDVPSGLESDTGQIHGACIRANRTVTLTCPKIGLVTYPGADMVGELVVADIGVLPEIVERVSSLELMNDSLASSLLPKRRADAHKSEVGRVLIVAGSPGFTGAAALASTAALRSGAGLVTLGIPLGLNAVLEEKVTEVMTLPLPETSSGALDASAYEEIMKQAASTDVVALGPGLSCDKSTVSLVQRLTSDLETKLVIDADGLNALIGKTELLQKRSHPTIITPHPGEFSRLFDVPVDNVQQDRIGFARKIANEWGVVVVLKGARSIVSSGDQTAIIPTGNPGMASAGTGDVLTGFVSGFMAQGANSYQAALLGTYLHGLAGDLAANQLTEWCLMASDLIDYLPEAIKKVKKANERCSTNDY